ncbi:MAG: four helix bundle protein [Bacteroidota bacterium]
MFELSKTFPLEERFSLTDQIRRSSRSVCSNLVESHAKRRYPKHFIAKLTDALGENNETLAWLRFARRCKYIDNTVYLKHAGENDKIGRLLSYILKFPHKFGANTSSQFPAPYPCPRCFFFFTRGLKFPGL